MGRNKPRTRHLRILDQTKVTVIAVQSHHNQPTGDRPQGGFLGAAGHLGWVGVGGQSFGPMVDEGD